jgi:CheY-like chemotaxis protein
MNSPLVLVIEDDEVVRDVIKRLLEMADYRVVVAGNGREGLKQHRLTAPALVITDLIMPEREGIETIMELRKHGSNARILAISGGGRIGNSEILSVARSLGADDILAKPFQPADLIGKVRQLLAAPRE